MTSFFLRVISHFVFNPFETCEVAMHEIYRPQVLQHLSMSQHRIPSMCSHRAKLHVLSQTGAATVTYKIRSLDLEGLFLQVNPRRSFHRWNAWQTLPRGCVGGSPKGVLLARNLLGFVFSISSSGSDKTDNMGIVDGRMGCRVVEATI